MIEPWQEILASAGFPTKVIVLDFETYFDAWYNLTSLSGVEYVADPRFEVTGLGVWVSGQDPHNGRYFIEPDQVKEKLSQLVPDISGVTIVGQNLKFDALVLHERYGITPKYTVDIIDLSRHLDARDRHNLAHLARKYHAPMPKGDTNRFKGLHWTTMTPEQRQELADYCLDDVNIETYLFKTLLPRITRPDVELRLAAQTLRQYLVPQIKIDTELGRRLIADMQSELQKPVDEVNRLGVRVVRPPRKLLCGWEPPEIRAVQAADISRDTTFQSLLTAALPAGEPVPMKRGKAGLVPALAKTDEQLDHLLTHPSPAVRALMVARKATDSWPTHISRVQKLMAQAAARGGYMGAPLVYYGARTGRWSGAGGVNFQNFASRDVPDLVKQVGHMLCAPAGYLFGTGDLSQIEARVVAWFAGQEDLLEAFAQKRDIYSEFAQEQIYHQEVRKPRAGDPPELAKALTTRRHVGKETILGAGFGMGGPTFYDRCKQKPSLKGADISLPLCRRAIGVYRRRYSMIPRLWQEVEKAWRFVARCPDKQATVSHYGRVLNFWHEHGAVIIQLPSGRCLFYPHATVSPDGTCRDSWGPIWGGVITENVVQATARDYFAEGLLRLEDAGFPVLMSVHDQAVCLIPDDSNAKVRLAEMHRLQTINPTWAAGLPVAVEGELSDRYK